MVNVETLLDAFFWGHADLGLFPSNAEVSGVQSISNWVKGILL